MKCGKFFAGVMKYHKQDGHAPNAIGLRDFLSHSVVGAKAWDHFRARPSRSSEGLLPKIQEITKANLLQPTLPSSPAFLEGRYGIRGPYDAPDLTGRHLGTNEPKNVIEVENSPRFDIDWIVSFCFARTCELTALVARLSWPRATNP